MRPRIMTNLRMIIPPAQRRRLIEQQQRLQQRLHRLTRPAWLGTMRRTTPLSYHWGAERGTPIDRYYIAHFLERYRYDIHGLVLEIKDTRYTTHYGHDVEQRDVLDIDPANPHATIIADLAAADSIPTGRFDCFVLTQTLQFIYDTRAALTHAHRILRPGGVLLVTVPAVSRIDAKSGIDTDYWRFTVASCARLFGDVFGPEQVSVVSYGNVLAAIAFLAGMAAEELAEHELEANDPYYPMLIGVRAVKRSCESESSPCRR